MRKIKNISIIALFIFLTISSFAQEIELTSTEVYIKSSNNEGILKFYPSGALFLDKRNSNTSTAFTINVSNATDQAFVIRKNWASPAVFSVFNDGTATLLGVAVTSDATLKKDIISLDSQIENIKKLKSVSYKWKKNSKKGDKKTIGLLAQDLEKVYPDMVFTNDSGIKAIYYDELIPVLIDVFKEQQIQIEKQKEFINELAERIESFEINCCDMNGETKSASITGTDTDSNISESKLYQNSPNPFSVSTTIRYSLSKNLNNVMINIYNMNGTQLKSIQLHHKGEGNIQINGGEFKAGLYLYSLIADGQIIDTKRMVLTD